MTLVLVLLILLLSQCPRDSLSNEHHDTSENEVLITTIYRPANCELKASVGKTVSTRYKAYIHESSLNGAINSLVDASNGIFKSQVGSSGMIPGWNRGIEGMCVGEKRQVVIPPSLAYGQKGSGKKIPPNATLRFEIELVSIFTKPNNALFNKMDRDSDKFISYDEYVSFFELQKQEVPRMGFERQDKNFDLRISWDEFTGPKGYSPDDL